MWHTWAIKHLPLTCMLPYFFSFFSSPWCSPCWAAPAPACLTGTGWPPCMPGLAMKYLVRTYRILQQYLPGIAHHVEYLLYFCSPDMTFTWARQSLPPSHNSVSSLVPTWLSSTCWRLWKAWVETRLLKKMFKPRLTVFPFPLFGSLALAVLSLS